MHTGILEPDLSVSVFICGRFFLGLTLERFDRRKFRENRGADETDSHNEPQYRKAPQRAERVDDAVSRVLRIVVNNHAVADLITADQTVLRIFDLDTIFGDEFYLRV